MSNIAYSIGGKTGRGGHQSTLYKIDLTSGATTGLGAITVQGNDNLDVEALEVNPVDDYLYALVKSPGNGRDGLVKIQLTADKNSIAQITYIGGNASTNITNLAGFTFDKTGTLYMAAKSPNGGNKTGLYTINLTTGNTTFLGDSTSSLGGLTFQVGSEKLYGLGKQGNNTILYELNPANGSIITQINVSGVNNQAQLEGFASTSNGELWAVDNLTGKLYTINSTTGAATEKVTSLGISQQTGDGFESLAIEVNRAPDAVNDAYQVNEDAPLNVNASDDPTPLVGILFNDIDPDSQDLDVLSLSSNGSTYVSDTDKDGFITLATQQGGTVTVNLENGSFVYNQNGQFNSLGVGETATDSFYYRLTDNEGGTDTAQVTITINGLNDPPDAVNDTATTNEDTPITGNVLSNDTDPEGDTLTVTNNTNPTNGTVTVNANGNYTYTPNANFNGTDSFTYTISDGNGGTDTATVNITVNPVNDPPTAVNDVAYTELGDPVTINVVNNDSDVDGTINPNSATPTTNPSKGTVGNNGNGTFTYTPTAVDNVQVDDTYADTFNYTVQDNNGLGSNPATVTVNVIDPGRQTNTSQGTISPGQPNQQNVVIELTTEEQTANSTTFVQGRITLPSLLQPNFNIAYVIDVSGSTLGSFGGSPVGNQNPTKDSDSNTILDAEIASFKALTQSILNTGFGNDEIDIGLISFSSNASLLGTFEPSDGNGVNDVLVNQLESLSAGGSTNFEAPLQQAINFFNSQPDRDTATNIVYFLSDGFPNAGGSFTDEVATLKGSPINAQLIAIGVGNGSSLTQLDLIDNTPAGTEPNNSAQQVTSTDQLTGALLGSPITGATLIGFDLIVNGNNLDGNPADELNIDIDDLTSTPFGFEFGPITLDGLNPSVGSNNTITAKATFDQDGDPLTTGDQTILMVNNIIPGALPTTI